MPPPLAAPRLVAKVFRDVLHAGPFATLGEAEHALQQRLTTLGIRTTPQTIADVFRMVGSNTDILSGVTLAPAPAVPVDDDGCPHCGGFGVIRVNYRSGEPFDIAMCRCRAGQWYRRGGPGMVRERIDGVGPNTRIAWLEDFEGDDA